MFKSISGNSYLKSLSILVSGTAVSQVVNLLSTPLLTRIYSPEEYALFQLFFSCATSLSVLATLRYELAIVNPDDEEETLDLVSICFYSSFGMALFSGALVFFWQLNWLPLGPFVVWYYLIPLYVVFAGLMQTMNYLSTKRGTFRKNMFSRIGLSINTAVFGIGTGMAGFRSAGLIVASVVGQLTGFILLANSLKEVISRPFTRGSVLLLTLRKYRKYPLYNGPHALIDVLQDNIIVFLIGSFFQISLVAFFGQALRILKAPFSFIGSAIFQVIYPKFNSLANQGVDLRPLLKKFFLQLGLVGLPFFLLLFIYGEEIFVWFLGADWREAGTIASILSPWLFLNFISSPFSCMALIRNKQDVAMVFTTINAILRIGAVFAGSLLMDYEWAFIFMSGAGTLVFVMLLFWYYRLGRPSPSHSSVH